MITKLIHKWTNELLDVIFPITCFGCGKKSGYLCSECRRKITSPPLVGVRNTEFDGCDKIFAACSYENPAVKKLLWHLKYRGKRKLAEILAEIIFQNIKLFADHQLGNAVSKSILIPIPLSKKRLKQRGYNQAELIAKALSLKTGIPVRNDILYKKFHTLSQVETKTRKERTENLKGSFEVKFGDQVSELRPGLRILLVDDIITTGATLNEAAKTLKSAGFEKVIGIAAAKS